MLVSLTQLSEICKPNTTHCAEYLDPLNKWMTEGQINTPNRMAAFLAQVITETGCFFSISENLNYSATQLLKIWPSHFTASNVNAYAHQPQKIASRVYANLYGNGNEATGDGWTYRGRGLIQVTFRSNYQFIATDLGKSLVETIEYLQTPEGAAYSALWFWKKHKLNDIADRSDIDSISRIVNGNTLGLTERHQYYNVAKQVLS